jgi:hypothetical protein
MAGTDRVRFCQHCRKSVYNLSAMSRDEAEAFVWQRDGRSCIQFYRRADGTMLTDDCPVGLRLLRRTARRSWALLAGSLVAVVGLFIGGVGFSAAKRHGGLRQLEPFSSIFAWLDPQPADPSTPSPTPAPATYPSVVRGEMCLPPQATPAREVR